MVSIIWILSLYVILESFNVNMFYLSLDAGTVRVWHSSTYRLETALNYGLERVWALAHLRGSNDVAIGYDEGSVIVKVWFIA